MVGTTTIYRFPDPRSAASLQGLPLDRDGAAALQLELPQPPGFGRNIVSRTRRKLNLAYTWSKNLTDSPKRSHTSPQNSYNIQKRVSARSLDRRHVFNLNYVYEIPFFAISKDLSARLSVVGRRRESSPSKPAFRSLRQLRILIPPVWV